MIKITITSQKKDPFELIITQEAQNSLKSNLWLPSNFIENQHLCKKCHEGSALNHCNLLDSILPTLIYFSDIVSCEIVTIYYGEENHLVTFSEPAQNACFIVAFYAMCYSKCDFFKRLKPFLKLYRIHITQEIFMHFILTTALIKIQLGHDHVDPKIDIFLEVKKFMGEINEKLTHILKNTKKFSTKDAAVNSLNIFFSLSHLSSEYLDEFYKEMICDINNTPLFYDLSANSCN